MMNYKKAFTLAEIMIVLTVIAVITAVLLPAARHATPDENVIKFKKAHNTLTTAIRELVTSDKYYLDGDLGTKADGTDVDNRESVPNYIDNRKYFCNTIADVVSTKAVNCTHDFIADATYIILGFGIRESGAPLAVYTVTDAKIQEGKILFDSMCKSADAILSAPEILTADDISIYQTGTKLTFSSLLNAANGGGRVFAKPGAVPRFKDQNGFDVAYKVLCIDIDGMQNGEDPFGYGVRADGKILNGARAQQWLEKSIQGSGE